ncbi:DUF817 family protein [Streptomyces platensis]|uniref:DUF817 family protein n=1 Tax=Streptomyces platensis TaxID=58346 RepID=UPI0036992F79
MRFTVPGIRRRTPLALSFILIGLFLWVAENLATYVGAWHYPYELRGRQPVAVDEFGSWPSRSGSPWPVRNRRLGNACALPCFSPRSGWRSQWAHLQLSGALAVDAAGTGEDPVDREPEANAATASAL